MFAQSLLLTGLASVASAHMLMSNPVPYGKSSLNNSPLSPKGTDFPCKMRPGAFDAEGASNVYAQGSTQQLSFIGSAVHGGGSCQVSITTDLEPTDNSVWKVIKSIEGGCPAKDTAGNFPEDPNHIDPYKYDFTIPAELAAGNYTLAWTWFNKVGNREMYMNCAPLTVTGSGGSENHLDTLPDMFTANIGKGCDTLADTDVTFPNAGSDVDQFNGATDAFKAPVGTACQASSGKQPVKTSAAATKPVVTPQPSSAPGSGNGGNCNDGKKSIPGGVFITVSEPANEQPIATQPVVTQPATTLAPVISTPVASEAPIATTAAPAPGSGTGGGSGEGSNPGSGDGSNPGSGDGSNPGSGNGNGGSNGGFAAGTACTTEGEWNCIGGSSFQRCASGAWSAPQGLSVGVTCTPGQSTDINLSAKRGETVMRRSSRIRV